MVGGFEKVRGLEKGLLDYECLANDLVACFNTMVYWSEPERVLAGINIRNALRPGGVFLTDNVFAPLVGGQGLSGDVVGDQFFDPAFFQLTVDEGVTFVAKAVPASDGTFAHLFRGGHAVVYRRP